MGQLIAIDTDQLDRIERELAALKTVIAGATITPPPEWRSIPDAAEHFGVTPDAVRKWILKGRIEARGSGRMRQVRVGSH